MAGEPELKRGDTGEWVAFLNQTLGYHGHHADDGDTFEEKTEHGVRQLQSERGLPVTGIMDEASWTALLAEPEPEQYALNLSDGPKVSDGKLVWTLRNDGPGKASQFVVRTELYDDAGVTGGRLRLHQRRGSRGGERGTAPSTARTSRSRSPSRGRPTGPTSSPTSTAPGPSPGTSISRSRKANSSRSDLTADSCGLRGRGSMFRWGLSPAARRGCCRRIGERFHRQQTVVAG